MQLKFFSASRNTHKPAEKCLSHPARPPRNQAGAVQGVYCHSQLTCAGSPLRLQTLLELEFAGRQTFPCHPPSSPPSSILLSSSSSSSSSSAWSSSGTNCTYVPNCPDILAILCHLGPISAGPSRETTMTVPTSGTFTSRWSGGDTTNMRTVESTCGHSSKTFIRLLSPMMPGVTPHSHSLTSPLVHI